MCTFNGESVLRSKRGQTVVLKERWLFHKHAFKLEKGSIPVHDFLLNPLPHLDPSVDGRGGVLARPPAEVGVIVVGLVVLDQVAYVGLAGAVAVAQLPVLLGLGSLRPLVHRGRGVRRGAGGPAAGKIGGARPQQVARVRGLLAHPLALVVEVDQSRRVN